MIGTTLSHYRIVEELGRGGMGIVYRAEDTKLERTVAIKVLPAAALTIPDDRARFYREAKAAAALNHPHIAAIHEIDEATSEGGPSGESRPFIAMEFVEGGTLQERIAQGPLKLPEAIRIATQIADALRAAHGKDIVHRDVKSANIMLSRDGQAKVLDFGLAQTTASTKLTQMGSTVGTIAYMSPEQARGEEVDGRTDLYSLGAVLYEMVAGRPPFGGAYEQAVIYSILNAEPEPLTALRTGVPMELERLVNKLLAKDAGRRYQSAADLIVDLESVPTQASAVSASSFSTISPRAQAEVPSWQRRYFWGIVAGALLAGTGIGALGFGTDRESEAPLQRVEIALKGYDNIKHPRMSPNGEYMGFRGQDMDGNRGIFLRHMPTGGIRYIENTQAGGNWEFDFSPDGGRLAFTESVNDGVFTVVVPNGIPVRRTDYGRFGFWADDRTIVMTDDRSGGGGGLYVLDLQLNEMRPLEIDAPALEEGYGNIIKTHIPGTDRAFGHQLIRTRANGVSGDQKVFTVDLSSGKLEITEPFAVNPEYVAGGYLMYQLRDDAGELVVRQVDQRSGAFIGQPRSVLDEGETIGWSRYAVTPSGDLLHTTSRGTTGAEVSLWLVDLGDGSADVLDVTLPDGASIFRPPSFSRDASQIAFTVSGSSGANAYLYDRREGLPYQITFNGTTWDAFFGPDDRSIFGLNLTDSTLTLVEMPVDLGGRAVAERVLEDVVGAALSENGSWIAALRMTPSAEDMTLELIDRVSGDVVWSESSELGDPTFSPDSRYVAFTDRSEEAPKIVVRPVTGVARHVVPGVEGRWPRWTDDGEYLFVRLENGIGRIPVRTEPVFSTLGDAELVLPLANQRGYDVSGDGRTIVVITSTIDVGRAVSPEPRVIWYQNWSAYLDREFGR